MIWWALLVIVPMVAAGAVLAALGRECKRHAPVRPRDRV
jgi:hypothetical protein